MTEKGEKGQGDTIEERRFKSAQLDYKTELVKKMVNAGNR